MRLTDADTTMRIQRNGEKLLLKALSLATTATPASDEIVAEELLLASLSLMTAVAMLCKRLGIDDSAAKLQVQAQMGAVFDAVHFVPRAVGQA